MSDKTCVVCGRSIRSGWKYCYEHRNYRGSEATSAPQREIKMVRVAIAIGVIAVFFGAYMIATSVLQLKLDGIFYGIIGCGVGVVILRLIGGKETIKREIGDWKNGR